MSLQPPLRRIVTIASLAVALGAGASVQAQQRPLDLIPYPAHVTATGDTLHFGGVPVVMPADTADSALVRLTLLGTQFLAEALGDVPRTDSVRSHTDVHAGAKAFARTDSSPRSAPAVLLTIDPSFPDSSHEAYALVVDSAGVRITARDHAGVFYGLQTLRELVRPDSARAADGWSIPAARIDDAPRFPYRGAHLDVVRHFFPVAFVERYIDLLARYKLNTFHWHLTDDQGWRIEIERYPRLTSVGSRRTETVVGKHFDPYVGDGVPYGGYYTQEEIRQVVAYAAERYVTVIPEIEMPGHARAALAAYPDLACTPGPFTVATRWGVFDDIFCPTEHTFDFLENVLTEVMALFPGTYIHVGGDEVPKRRWRESDAAQAVMRREGLANEAELQSYFMRRIEAFLTAHGRRLIGWDEILEGGLPPEATVMSWRGTAGGIAAARAGHDVIMTPSDFLYFDHYQGDPATEPLAIGGFTPLGKVYAFEPVPDSLTADQARHILGAQANVWTEYIATESQVEYMLFPRLLALAEVVWSPRASRDWESFEARLPSQLEALDRAWVRYRKERGR
ncbi:MAG TPA: beta-N-acetylhexosaminidase [Gemmatimonadaceae bacterium]|nr:beta-N-acetylhexosaminidase [Gemmatimonadaceae bacterium]